MIVELFWVYGDIGHKLGKDVKDMYRQRANNSVLMHLVNKWLVLTKTFGMGASFINRNLHFQTFMLTDK